MYVAVCHQTSEMLPVEFLHDFGNPRDAPSQQHVNFSAGRLDVFEVHPVEARGELADCLHRIMPTRSEMAHVRSGAHRFGKTGHSLRNIFRTLIREFLPLEILMMDAEGQACLREAPLDLGKDAGRRIAGDMPHTQQVGKARRVLNVLAVFDGSRVVRDTANPGAVELGSGRAEQIIAGCVHPHGLAPGHFDFLNPQSGPLHDHVLERQAVVAVGPDADPELAPDIREKRQLRCRHGETRSRRLGECSSCDHGV